MTTQKDVTVYIGRFHPFHLGHAHVLERALKTSKLVIVLVGSAGLARSPKNPFSFDERKEMISKWERGIIHNAAVRILPIRDVASNSLWIRSVQNIVKTTMTKVAVENNILLTSVVITGSDRDDSTWYLNSFPQWKQDLVQPTHTPISGTKVRQVLYDSELPLQGVTQLGSKLPESTMRFLVNFVTEQKSSLDLLRREHAFIKKSKAAWAVAPYAPTFQTADAVVIQSGHVLVVLRGSEPGYGLWALPGGYVNQRERIKDAAIRELIEETGISFADGKRSKEITASMLNGAIKAKETFDDPSRSERGRIITEAFLFRLDDEKPLPKVKGQNIPTAESGGALTVETLQAKWVPLAWVFENSNKFFEDHALIIEAMAAKMDE